MHLNLTSDNDFIKHLTQIVEKNISKEDFGVKELSDKTEMTRSQIHRRLKSINNKSVTQFVREVRLNKAKDLLQTENITVSELAYRVGFSSPSYFIKCFREYYGYPPGEFMRNNQEEQFELQVRGNKNKTVKWLTGIVLVVILSVVSYIIIVKPQKSLSKMERSIAVLPLKVTEEDQETMALAQGIMEDILTRLSDINEFKVISRISGEKYTNSLLSVPEIAKELGVNYILEGSILREGKNIRIYLQLIDAKNDKHIWADSYDDDLNEVFNFISEVATHVAHELQVVISETDIAKMEKQYTANIEAYNLYLRGRYFWSRRTKNDLIKSINYFTKALDIDSNYSLAYAGLADAWFILTWWEWYPREEGYLESKKYVQKALNLDNQIAEVHATNGALEFWFNYNYKLAEKEIRKSIDLNPNYAVSYMYYSELCDILLRPQEARLAIEKSIELNPTSKINYSVSVLNYYNEGKLNMALSESEKIMELDPGYVKQYVRNYLIFIRKKDEQKALDNLISIVQLVYPDSDYSSLIGTLYKESGIKGVNNWIVKTLNDKNIFDDYVIAQLFALEGNKQESLIYLKKASESCIRAPRMNSCIDFKILHEEEEFKALLKKMKLQ